ncbi:MAG: helicase RepA family protein [Clostridia bacterium]
MPFEEKTTALIPSVGADGGQPISININQSIADTAAEINENFGFEEVARQMRQYNSPGYMRTFSMNDLYENVYDSRPPIVDGLLYSGTYLFAGAPKVGKSFFMAQLAYHVSMGSKLWDYEVKKGVVLYLALEDTEKRLQERLFRMYGTDSAENLHFSISAKKIGAGLDKQLKSFLQKHPDTKLIIIDTLQKIRESGGNNYSYASDYQIVGQLKQFSDTHKICLLLVHHTRKQPTGDKFDMISGTNGLLGAADGAFLLQKEKRTSDAATLDISGRDQPDQRLHLRRDADRLIWQFEKAETELWQAPPDPLLEAVAALVTQERPTWNGTATGLVELLGMDLKPNTLSMRLNVNAGRLMDEHNVRYANERSHAGRCITLTLLSEA